MTEPLSKHDSFFFGSGAAASAQRRVERRGSRRFEVAWEAVIEGKRAGGAEFRAKSIVVSISSTGARLLASVDVEAGAKLTLSARVPLGKQSWMSYPAEVVRVEKLDRENAIAVRFESLRPLFASR